MSAADELQQVLRDADVAWCRQWGDEWCTPEFLRHLADAAITAGWSRTVPHDDSEATP